MKLDTQSHDYNLELKVRRRDDKDNGINHPWNFYSNSNDLDLMGEYRLQLLQIEIFPIQIFVYWSSSISTQFEYIFAIFYSRLNKNKPSRQVKMFRSTHLIENLRSLVIARDFLQRNNTWKFSFSLAIINCCIFSARGMCELQVFTFTFIFSSLIFE